MLISGELVNLRPFALEDADFLHRWGNDPEYTGRFEPFEPVTMKELVEWLPSDKPDVLWYIIETKDGEKVGQIVARMQENGSYQVGYRVIPSARGRGIATAAVRILVRHLFALGVHHITAEVNSENKQSIRVLQKVGFKRIAYKVRALEVNKVWLDGIVFEVRG